MADSFDPERSFRDSTDRHDLPAESEPVEEGARARDLPRIRPAIRGGFAEPMRMRRDNVPEEDVVLDPEPPRARDGRSSRSPRRISAPVSCRSEVNGRPLTRPPR